MKTRFYLLPLLFPVAALAQTTYPIEKFSDTYRGEVTAIPQGDNTQYSLSIFNKDNKPVIKLSPYAGFGEFDLNDQGKIKSNVYKPPYYEFSQFELNYEDKITNNTHKHPYDEQSLIVSQDVNFDGVADLVIRNGFNSCHGSPSYDIYLQQGDKLVHSPEFSRLAQDYCGMFRINNKTKTLHTMTKSEAGRHHMMGFNIENDKPVVAKIVETEVLDSPLSITQYKEQNLINGKMVEKTYQQISVLVDVEKKEPKFGFVMDSPESADKEAKVMYLLQGRDEKLHFVLTDWYGVIKQHYDGGFIYEAVISRLTFGIGQDTYMITDQDMTIITPEKTIIRPGNDRAKFNRLEMAVKGAKNVTVRKRPIQYNPLPKKQ